MDIDIHNIFSTYEKRFDRAREARKIYRPWIEEEKSEIIQLVKKSLGFKNQLVPEIKSEVFKTEQRKDYDIQFLKFTSWENVFGAALLYMPKRRKQKNPFVLICCGHGAYGKLNPGYQALAGILAQMGIITLMPDNIGQGERVHMGHKEAVVPLSCGLTIQGLIVMETMAWLAWAKNELPIDFGKMAAVGNSGGGTLTSFLSVLCPELPVLSSSGHPGSLEFIARKEKQHCACNIVPGYAGKFEMWQLYGCFSPKHLFLFQGRNDHLFPEDLFYSNARKTSMVYEAMNAPHMLRTEIMPGYHPWDNERRQKLACFLAEQFDLPLPEQPEDDCLTSDDTCFTHWPREAITVNELSRRLSGCTAPDDLRLWDIFPPDIPECEIRQITPRGDTRWILAQYEAFLSDKKYFHRPHRGQWFVV
ncbi:MAG TPA: hypothetical protein DC049_07720, partial [Spirochaetia bacterium]|nr:hypothetical protein [Spirochaetia bacterium]